MLNKNKSSERKKKKQEFKDLRLKIKEQNSKKELKRKVESELKAGDYCLKKALSYRNLPFSDGLEAANYFLSASCYDNAALASLGLSQPRTAFGYFYKAVKCYKKSYEINPEESRLSERAKHSREMADICVYEAGRRFLRNYRATIGLKAKIDGVK